MTPGANDDFFREFIKATGDTSLGNSDRSIPQSTRERALRALLAVAAGQGPRGRETVKKLVEQSDTLGLKRQKEAVQMMAAPVARLERNPAYAIGPDVSRALADYMDYAERKKAGKAGTFEEYVQQEHLFDGPSFIAQEVLKLLGSGQSPAAMAEYVRTYAADAINTDPAGDLLGAARTREEIWRAAKRAVEERRAKDSELEGKMRFSIVSLAGRDVAIVDDLEAAKKINPKMPADVEGYILEHLEDGIQMLAGGTADITADTAHHFAWSAVRGKYSNNRRMRKARAQSAIVFRDLIKMFKADDTTKQTNYYGEDDDVWTCRLPFGLPQYGSSSEEIVGGIVYDADVIIKDEGGGKFLYDVSNLKRNEALTQQLTAQAKDLFDGRKRAAEAVSARAPDGGIISYSGSKSQAENDRKYLAQFVIIEDTIGENWQGGGSKFVRQMNGHQREKRV